MWSLGFGPSVRGDSLHMVPCLKGMTFKVPLMPITEGTQRGCLRGTQPSF